MATLSFEVHADKENASSASIHRKGIKGSFGQPLGSRDQNKFQGPTIRKALQNVNQQASITSSRGLNFAKNVSKEPFLSQPKQNLAARPEGIENMPMKGFAKKIGKLTISKKVSHGSGGLKKSSKPKSSKVKVKADVEPIPNVDIPNEEEYDSDSIFPRSERLSSYVDKLLMWRPPCLFGSLPESDPEISDHDDDLIWTEEICNVPVFLSEVPEFPSPEELPEDLVEIPSLKFDEDDRYKFNRMKSPEPLSDQSFNASLPLGPLQIVQDGLHVEVEEIINTSLEVQ